MIAIAGFICSFVFGWGLLVSGMMQPTKVLAFLDIFGAWDPSLAVVMAAALAVSGIGYAFARRRDSPVVAPQSYWPTATQIDPPLVAGAAMFGVGWGLAGLCPGPALENLATLSPQVGVFVVAMAVGMVTHDIWRRLGRTAPRPRDATGAADG